MMEQTEPQYVYQLAIILKCGKEFHVYDVSSHSDWDEALNDLHFRISEYNFNRFGHQLIRSGEIASIEIVGMGIRGLEE